MHATQRDYRPVVIIGAGPVGLVLAACLARLGVASTLVEKRNGPGEGSRAVCLSRRSLEILDWAGCVDAIVKKGLGWTSGRTYFAGDQVHRLQMPHDGDQKYLPMLNLQQYYVEEFLSDFCRSSALIELRSGYSVRHAVRDDAGVCVSFRDGASSIEADWVVAADGARSVIRKALDLRLKGESYSGRYLIADIRMPCVSPVERRLWFDPPSNPGSTVIMHRQPDDLWRIDYQLPDGDGNDEEQLQPERVRERIARHLEFIGETAPWELIWRSIYRAHTLALERYRHGRVLFAGDAAHLVPIFGVRGLNSGIADAHNLAWKLARVVNGVSPAGLLDSYDVERRAATMEIFDQSSRTTRFVTPATRGDKLFRNAVLSLALNQSFVRPLIDPRQSRPNDYIGSALNTPDTPGGGFGGGPVSGAVVRNMRVRIAGDERWLLDMIGTDFVCFCFDDDTHAALAAELPNVRIVSLAGCDAERFFDAPSGAVYLIRPDGHVAARWRAPDAARVREALLRARGLL